jgi:hypothetical protein
VRLAAAVTAVSLCWLLAACGGSGGEKTAAGTTPGADDTLKALWSASGDDVAIVPGTSDYEPGLVRVSFLVVDSKGELVLLPSARIWVARGLDDRPFLESTAKLERIAVPGGAQGVSTHIYVTHIRIRKPGTYWLLAEPEGGSETVHALGNVIVHRTSSVPEVGDSAPASETPTLASTGGDIAKLTTRTPPDQSLLRNSVAESLHTHVPFVVTFATPKFCTSRMCGPVVDVVSEVADHFEGGDVRFIHVEVYEDNDPAKGYNRWMREWGLHTEPWTFLVNRDGKIAERFEGPISVDELEQAVGEKLLAQ